MPSFLTNELLWKSLIEGVILALVVWGTQFYFQKKYAPDIAAATLKRENLLNSKRDAYMEAINIANKYMANAAMGDIDAITGKKFDKRFIIEEDKISLDTLNLEINNAYSKLMIYAADTNILSCYYRIFVSAPNENHVPVIWLKKFLSAIRKDLGSDNKLPDEYEMLYIVMPKKKQE